MLSDYLKARQAVKNGTTKPVTAVISSKDLAKMIPKNLKLSNNGSFANVQSGDYECSKGLVYFRSKWESNYALYLDFLVKNGYIKDWEYEVDNFFFDKIKMGTKSYRPDFKVWNKDGSFYYVEIKGYFDAKSKTKMKRMKKYFPHIKVELVEKAGYVDMMKKMSGLIKFYK